MHHPFVLATFTRFAELLASHTFHGERNRVVRLVSPRCVWQVLDQLLTKVARLPVRLWRSYCLEWLPVQH